MARGKKIVVRYEMLIAAVFKIEGALGGVFAVSILLFTLLAFTCWILAHRNLKPGTKINEFVSFSKVAPNRFYTPRGLFWLKAFKYSILAELLMITVLVILAYCFGQLQ